MEALVVRGREADQAGAALDVNVAAPTTRTNGRGASAGVRAGLGGPASALKRWRRWWRQADPFTRDWRKKRDELAPPPGGLLLRTVRLVRRAPGLADDVDRGRLGAVSVPRP